MSLIIHDTETSLDLIAKGIAPINKKYIRKIGGPFFKIENRREDGDGGDDIIIDKKEVENVKIIENKRENENIRNDNSTSAINIETTTNTNENNETNILIQSSENSKSALIDIQTYTDSQATMLKSRDSKRNEYKDKEDKYNNENSNSNSNRRKKNKNYLRAEQIDGVKICPYIGRGLKCNYGNDCKDSHDIPNYLLKKEEDISNICYMYKKYGKCSQGLTCRFGNIHINKETNSNIINDDAKEYESEINVYNTELMRKVAKYQIDYPLAEIATKECNKYSNILGQSRNNEVKLKKDIFDQDKIQETTVPIEVPVIPSPLDDYAGFLAATVFNYDTTKGPTYLKPLKPKNMDWIKNSGMTILAPLTTVGNLPFRRVCKKLGADVTVGEMAMSTNLLAGHQPEWALIKRHPCEDKFGIQIAGGHVDTLSQSVELLNLKATADFIDLNCGCPIDIVVNKGSGSGLLRRPARLEQILRSITSVSQHIPITMKTRIGFDDNKLITEDLIPMIRRSGISALTLHGRTRQQRYSRLADWNYVGRCVSAAHSPFLDDPEIPAMPLIGNGDIYSFADYESHMNEAPYDAMMIGRGALIKPWIFTEIKERKEWDISASERMELFQDFCNYGLEHWGSDNRGVSTTRRFLLEWMSFTNRYIPLSLLDYPCKINYRPPAFIGRGDTETMLGSPYASDWIKISEMFLGKVSDSFKFEPKHRANSYKGNTNTEGADYEAQG